MSSPSVQQRRTVSSQSASSFCFGVRGQLTIAREHVHPEKKALPFPLHAAESPVQAERPGFQRKAMLPCSPSSFCPAIRVPFPSGTSVSWPGLFWGNDEGLGPAMCILVFQLHDRQDEAAALLIEPGRGRGSVFDALQEIFRQDI